MDMITTVLTITLIAVLIYGIYKFKQCTCGETMYNTHRCVYMENFTDINRKGVIVKKHETAFLEPTSVLQSSIGALAEKFIFTNIQDKTVFRLKIDTDLQNIIPPQAYNVYLYTGTERKMIGQLKQDNDSRYKIFYESEDLSLYDNKGVVVTLTINSRTEDVLKGDF